MVDRVYRKPGHNAAGDWVLELNRQVYGVRDVIRIAKICRSAAVLRFQRAAAGEIALEDILQESSDRRRAAHRPPAQDRGGAIKSRAEGLSDLWRLALCGRR